MTLEQIAQKIDRWQERQDKKFNALYAEIRKELKAEQWVKVSFVLKATGWNSEKLRQAREQGLVKWEKRNDGYWYNIKSIDPLFLNK